MQRRTIGWVVGLMLGIGLLAWLSMRRPVDAAMDSAAALTGSLKRVEPSPLAREAPAPATPSATAEDVKGGSQGTADAGAVPSRVRNRADREGVYAAMQSAMPEIERCYDDWLRLEPTLGGKMSVKLTISGDAGVD